MQSECIVQGMGLRIRPHLFATVHTNPAPPSPQSAVVMHGSGPGSPTTPPPPEPPEPGPPPLDVLMPVVVDGMMVWMPVPLPVAPPPEPLGSKRDGWLLEHAAKPARAKTNPT